MLVAPSQLVVWATNPGHMTTRSLNENKRIRYLNIAIIQAREYKDVNLVQVMKIALRNSQASCCLQNLWKTKK